MKERLGMLPNCIEQAAKRAGDWFSDTRASITVTVDVPMEAKHGRVSLSLFTKSCHASMDHLHSCHSL
jgi:hypothetical protein